MSLPKNDTLLHNLKKLAYARIAPLPDRQNTFPDLVLQAKTFLCHKTHTLFNDVVWDQYADEEIVVEYFAWIFAHDQDFRDEFEARLKGTSKPLDTEESLYEWFDQQTQSSGFEYSPE